MPELPEVETLKRGLQKLTGKTIKKVFVDWPKMVRPLSVDSFYGELKNKKIINVDRRAKMLVISLSRGKFLLVHLKMTGQLIFKPRSGKLIIGGHPQKGGVTHLPNKFTHAEIDFTDGSKLYFNDQRKFGWLKLLTEKEKEELLEGFGVEPLSREFSLKRFKSILQKYPRRKIKQILMDQTLISGVGNIYADESCFYARVHPTRIVVTLTDGEIAELHEGIKKILRLSITKKGTSFNRYVNADATPGGFVPYLKVYGRKGEECYRCGAVIHRIKVNGRGTHYCDNCQK